jgi:hypothetical protein
MWKEGKGYEAKFMILTWWEDLYIIWSYKTKQLAGREVFYALEAQKQIVMSCWCKNQTFCVIFLS